MSVTLNWIQGLLYRTCLIPSVCLEVQFQRGIEDAKALSFRLLLWSNTIHPNHYCRPNVKDTPIPLAWGFLPHRDFRLQGLEFKFGSCIRQTVPCIMLRCEYFPISSSAATLPLTASKHVTACLKIENTGHLNSKIRIRIAAWPHTIVRCICHPK